MSSSILSSRQLVRLARKSKLSLTLRAEWQRKVSEQDPLNSQHDRVWFWNLAILAGIAFAITVVGYAGDSTPAKTYLHYVPIFGIPALTAVVSLMVSLDMFVFDRFSGGRFRGSFSRLVYYIGTAASLEQSAENLALSDLHELRGLAKHSLIDAAYNILRHEAADNPSSFVDTIWSAEYSRLQSVIETRYKTFEQFNLVHGGYDFFFSEAHKLIAEEEAKAKEPVVKVTSPALG